MAGPGKVADPFRKAVRTPKPAPEKREGQAAVESRRARKDSRSLC